jgi:hypothetical protein
MENLPYSYEVRYYEYSYYTSSTADGESGCVSDGSISVIATPADGHLIGSGSFTTSSCVPPPTVDIKANGSDAPVAITYNTPATISWTSTEVNSCTVTPCPSGVGGTCTDLNNTGKETDNLTASQTYDLSCTSVSSGTISDSVTVTVNVASGVTLTTVIDSGSGSITGPGISCAGDCSEGYAPSTWVTLSANPSSGYTFNSWSGACAGQGSACSILMDGDKTTGASFTAPFTYTLSNSGASSVTRTNSTNSQDLALNSTNLSQGSKNLVAGAVLALVGDSYTTNTITKTLVSGVTQPVTLSVSGEPSGVTETISNQGCSPDCTSVITFTIPASVSNGTYPITVTGSPGNQTTSFDLVINRKIMTVTCTPSPAIGVLGQTITWTATVGGEYLPPLTYTWSGAGIPTDPAPSSNPYSLSYSTIGTKTATVSVVDSSSPTPVVGICTPGSVQINFNPVIEEF